MTLAISSPDGPSHHAIHDAEGGYGGGRASCLGGSPPSSLDMLALSRHQHICGRRHITLQCLICGHQMEVLAGSRDRTCPACAMELYRRIYERFEARLCKSRSLLFLTLTHMPVPRQDPVIVRNLGIFLNKLLHRRRFRLYKGVLATVECKKTDLGWFYYHVHCLVEGPYVPQEEISRAWRQISGFPIVHVKRIYRTPKRALRYVLKYVLKGMNFTSFQDREDFKASFRGVRFIRSYGDFYAMEYRRAKHVYFPCPGCGAVRAWVVLDFCNVVDLFEGEPYMAAWRPG